MAFFSLRHRFLCDFHRYFSSATFFYFPRSKFSTISYSEARAVLGPEFDPEKVISIYDTVAGNLDFYASRYVQRIALKRLARARRFADIETLIEKQKKDPKIKDERFLTNLIHGYGRVGMLKQAIRTFNQMDELGTPRSSLSFNALLDACKESKKFDEVPKLFTEIPQKFGISPDKVSYGILIKSFCESGVPESGYLILDEMEKKNVEITSISYSTLLDAFYKKNKIEDAEKIWEKMVEKGFSHDVIAHTIRLMHAARRGKPEEALKLLHEMVSEGIKPDTVTYNLIITCYCKNGRIEDAKKVYEDLERNGCAPNFATFKHFVYFLCRNGDYDYAFEVGKRSIKQNKVPDFATMKYLIKGLAKKSRSKDARELIQELKKRYPANVVTSWEKVEAELGLDSDKGNAKGSLPLESAQGSNEVSSALKSAKGSAKDSLALETPKGSAKFSLANLAKAFAT